MKRAALTLMTRYARPALVGLLSSTLAACVVIDEGDSDSGGDGGTNGDDNGNGNGNGNGDGADGTGGSGQAPSMSEVGDCREDCDDLLFWNCVDATEHETCYTVCTERSSESLSVFGACVQNTTPDCDAATPCYTNLLDEEPIGDDGGSTTCAEACEEWLGAGCEQLSEAPSCQAFCDGLPESIQDFVVECIEGRDGCTLPEECLFEEEEEGGAEGE